LAAVFGGYALATASSLLISQLLMHVIGKYQAIHTGLLLTFLVYAMAAMWVFSVNTAKKAWLGILKSVFICFSLSWILMQITGATS